MAHGQYSERKACSEQHKERQKYQCLEKKLTSLPLDMNGTSKTKSNAPVQCQLRGKETTRSTSASISSLSGEMVIKTKWYLHKRYSGTSERIIQWTKNKVTELNKK